VRGTRGAPTWSRGPGGSESGSAGQVARVLLLASNLCCLAGESEFRPGDRLLGRRGGSAAFGHYQTVGPALEPPNRDAASALREPRAGVSFRTGPNRMRIHRDPESRCPQQILTIRFVLTAHPPGRLRTNYNHNQLRCMVVRACPDGGRQQGGQSSRGRSLRTAWVPARDRSIWEIGHAEASVRWEASGWPYDHYNEHAFVWQELRLADEASLEVTAPAGRPARWEGSPGIAVWSHH